MAAQFIYGWEYIAPGATVFAYVHGFSFQEAAVFSATVSVSPLSHNPIGLFAGISMTQNEVYQHVDGTVARKVYVQNLSPFFGDPCSVGLSVIIEPIGG